MRRFAIAGLCALSVLAAQVAVASAETTPEWYECVKLKHGPQEKGCAKEGGKGGRVLVPGVGTKAFMALGKNLSLTVVEPGIGTDTVRCSSVREEGERAVPDLLKNVTIRFGKCTGAGKCFNEAEDDEPFFTTETLSGELGYISRSPLKVGVKLTSQADPGGPFLLKVRCGPGYAELWAGSLNGELAGAVNMASRKASFVYASGPYLGEVEPGYTPLVDPPFEGEAAGLFRAEVKQGADTGGFKPPRPGALEGSLAIKSEWFVKA